MIFYFGFARSKNSYCDLYDEIGVNLCYGHTPIIISVILIFVELFDNSHEDFFENRDPFSITDKNKSPCNDEPTN